MMEEEAVVERKSLKSFLIPSLILVFILAAGVISGYLLSSRKVKKPLSPAEMQKKAIKKGMTFGIDNPQVFKDTAVGIIEVNDGSFTDEGTHKLIREGGESQTAYLTSTVLDLNRFIGKKVKVWGETFAAKKAPWLMDVGKVEVLE